MKPTKYLLTRLNEFFFFNHVFWMFTSSWASVKQIIVPLQWCWCNFISKFFLQAFKPEVDDSVLHLVKVDQFDTHLFLWRGSLAAAAPTAPTAPHASRSFWIKLCSSSPPPAWSSRSFHGRIKGRTTGLRSLSSQVSRWDSCAADFCPNANPIC